MKILLLTYSFAPKVGGIESHSLILTTELTQAGYEVCLMTMTESESSDHYPFRVVRKPGLWEQMKWFRWSDLVFENNPVMNLSLLNAWFRRPRLTAIHTWIGHPGSPVTFTVRFKRWWTGRADSVIVVSEAIQKSIAGQSTVIQNPYEDELFYVRPEIKRSSSFVFLGRLVSDKGLQLALEAVRKLLDSPSLSATEKEKVQLTVIGDGPQQAELIAQTQALGIEAVVDFRGVLKEKALARALNEHQFVLIPSIWEEPFGMVALEAMACGCIPIASISGGLPEAVGRAGLLFEKGNSDELAGQMTRLLQDKTLRQDLRDKAQGHLKQHTAKNIVRQYISCIEKFRSVKMITELNNPVQ